MAGSRLIIGTTGVELWLVSVPILKCPTKTRGPSPIPLQAPKPRPKHHMEVSLNYCSQNGGNLYRAPYCNGNPNIGPRIDSNLDQSPHGV